MNIRKCWLLFITLLIISCTQSKDEKEIIYVSRDKLNKKSCIVVKGDVAEPIKESEELKRAKEGIREAFGSSEKRKDSPFVDPDKKYPEYYALSFNFLLPDSFVIKGLDNLPERAPHYFNSIKEYPGVDSTLTVRYFNLPSTEGLSISANLIETRVSIFDEDPGVVAMQSCVDYLASVSGRNINVIDTEIWKIDSN